MWVLNQVTPASPAEQAGFRPGDVVVEFGGKPVESIKEVTKITTGDVWYAMVLVVGLKLYRGFLGPVSIKKTGPPLAFVFSLSNKIRRKAFAILSKKKCVPYDLIYLQDSFSFP
jgi:membrane-associated protease RseP (regulator of RpoE activity)